MTWDRGYPGLDKSALLSGAWTTATVKYEPPTCHWFSLGDAKAPCGAVLIQSNAEGSYHELSGNKAIDHIDSVTCVKCLRMLAQRGAKP